MEKTEFAIQKSVLTYLYLKRRDQYIFVCLLCHFNESKVTKEITNRRYLNGKLVMFR